MMLCRRRSRLSRRRSGKRDVGSRAERIELEHAEREDRDVRNVCEADAHVQRSIIRV